MSSNYCCDNLNLKSSIEKVLSTSGENAVWNKDTNTVYYNPKILKTNSQTKGTTINQNPLSSDLFKAIQEAKKNGVEKPLVIPLQL